MNFLVAACSVVILLGIIPINAQAQVINSFETDADLGSLKANNTQLTPTREHVTQGRQALQIEFLPAEWPNVTFTSAQPWNWHEAGGLALDVINPGAQPLTFSVRVDDDAQADGNVHCRTGSGTIEAGKTATFVMDFKPDPASLGMRGLPPRRDMRSLGASGSGPFDPGHIVAFQVFMHRPDAPKTLILDNVRLVPPRTLEGVVDRYGQYTGADWPGKVHTDADLVEHHTAEEAALKAHPALPDRDVYGGWAVGPKLPATGFFRTQKVDGKWALVTPQGHLFFSLGIDVVDDHLATFTQGREQLFTWLPKAGDPLAKQIGNEHAYMGPIKEGATFDFYQANLQRKFGTDYQSKWRDEALQRLPAWGFNTIGNWSDSAFMGNHRVPYVATADIAFHHAAVSSGSDYWGKMHDPFDPRFARDTAESLRPIAAKVKGDPWCLGYFVDNELSWAGNGPDGRYGLAIGSLAANAADSPAKRAFLAQLKTEYGDAAKLNDAWGTHFASWNDIEPPCHLSAALTEACKADLSAFVKEFARQYFRVVSAELKRLDPDHLYLGCRFAWSAPEAVEAAAEYCDVVSFNIYAPRVDPQQWSYLAALNKPCIIGEFHFGALDRGMWHPGLVSTPNQQARAEMYIDYVRSVLDNPAFVGCHWFQYIDEPLTGRTWDGENYNIGFVSVTDTPYPEMVQAAQQVHTEAYTRRWPKTELRLEN